MALAGFSAGEAEGLRRAMSRKRSDEAIAALRASASSTARWRTACRARWPSASSSRFGGFSGFGFPKSHAAAFGLLAYQSTWLRVHRGPEFLCALLNEQPMGFYPPDALVHEAQRRGIELRTPDVNAKRRGLQGRARRRWRRGPRVQIGLGYVNGLRSDDAAAVVAERERSGPLQQPGELASRAGIRDDALERLAWAGACESIEPDSEGATREARRIALWRLGVASAGPGRAGQLSLPLQLPERAGAARARRLGAWRWPTTPRPA